MSKELKESLRMFYLIETVNEERDFEPEKTRVEHEHGEAKKQGSMRPWSEHLLSEIRGLKKRMD